MRITLKTASGTAKYLPPGSHGNSAMITVADGLPPDGIYLVTHNGAAVTIAMRDSVTLAEGDTLAVMPPLRGG